MQIFPITRRKTVGVKVGHLQVGVGAPVVAQSMTNTDTADVAGTVAQCKELAEAGSELVRITVNMPGSAAAVAEIVARLRDAGCVAPIIGDFHYNGHVLLTKYPDCARALDKYRINPGNVGAGARRDEQFATICTWASRKREWAPRARCGPRQPSASCCRKASATRFAFRSRRVPEATAARKFTPRASCSMPSDCVRSRPA